MSNFTTPSGGQSDDTRPDDQHRDDTNRSIPVQPVNPPKRGPEGATVEVKKPGLLGGVVGGFVGGLAEEWRKDREFKRELKRAKQEQTALAASTVVQSASPASVSDEQEQSKSGEDLLQQERNKRIQMISDFTDIKESFDHKIKRIISSLACAGVPWLLVIFLTSDVGEYFAGQAFTMADWKVVGIFGITALLEIVIAVVTNAWGNSVHDANATDVAADKQKLQDRAKTQAAAWAVLSLVSGFALFMFLMQQSADTNAIATGALTATQVAHGLHGTIDWTFGPAMINVVLRVVGTLSIDPACVFAVHQTTKNLDQFLKQQNQVTTAITQVSDTFDKQQEAAARAQMRQKENERFLELKGKMDEMNATMMGRMSEKMLDMSDQMFEHMQLPPARIVEADDDDDGRRVRRLRG